MENEIKPNLPNNFSLRKLVPAKTNNSHLADVVRQHWMLFDPPVHGSDTGNAHKTKQHPHVNNPVVSTKSICPQDRYVNQLSQARPL